MQCNACTLPARGVCRFCGAGVCGTHARSGRIVSGVATAGQPEWGSMPRETWDYVVVENAMWCGRCTVRTYRKA